MHPVLCKIHHALASHFHEFRAYWICLALLGISANTIPVLWSALQQIGVGITLLILACVFGWISTELFLKGPKLSSKGKAVLITGCDSGFGYNLAKRLDSEGYLVFAGCLFPQGKGASNLAQGSSRLHVVPLDVTDEQQVRNAALYVKTHLKGNQLWSVVANAGVNVFLEFEWIRTEDVSHLFDVNVMGVVRTSKAFLPMLRNSRGRLILVSSYAGRIASNMIVPYSMTKAAVISMADGLRREMSKWGVHVCTVEPFYYETAINPSGLSSMMSKFERDVPEDLRADYGDYPENAFRWFLGLLQRISRKDSSEVVEQMFRAVADSEPKRHYRSDGVLNWLLYMSLFVLPSAAQDIACSFTEPHFKADKKSGLLLKCST